MADVFSTTPPDDDEEETPGLRVAGALTGDGEDAPEKEESPQAEQPQGTVDDSGQSYLTPAGADDGESEPPQASEADVPVSADTKAYMTPIAPPTLAKPADYADHSADTAAMTAQKQAESQQNIKPSIGRRILAGLAGGAVAFGGGDGSGTVERVLNRPAERAQREWALQEAPIQAKINADQAADAATTRANAVTEQQNRLAEQNYGLQERGQIDAARAANYKAQADQRQQTDDETPGKTGWQRDDPNNPLGGYHATSVSGKIIKSTTPPASVQSDPEYKIAAAAKAGTPYTREQQQVLRSGAKSLTFRPPPNPRQPSEGEISLGQARAAFIKENGRPPETLDEQNQVTQAAKGTLDRTQAGAMGPGEIIAQGMSEKQAWINKHQQKSDVLGDPDPNTGVRTMLAPKGSFVGDDGNPMSQKDVSDKLEEFRTKLNANPVMRRSGTMVDPQGNTVTNRFSRTPQTAPAVVPPPQASPNSPAAALSAPVYKAKSGATVTVNTRVVVNGRPGVVTGFDKNGKPQVDYGR